MRVTFNTKKLSKKYKDKYDINAESASQILQKEVKNEISSQGLIKTGKMHDSVDVINEKDLNGVVVDTDYARRIELGFSGVDSLGRIYDQDGHHFFRTAFNNSKSKIKNELVK